MDVGVHDDDELVKLGGDLMRGGQLRPLHVERAAYEIGGREGLVVGVGEEVALQRRVHDEGGDVPDGDERGEHGEERQDAVHAAAPHRPPLPACGERAGVRGRQARQRRRTKRLRAASSRDDPSPLPSPRKRGEGTRQSDAPPLTHRSYALRAAPAARAAPLRGTPASRECRACGRAGNRQSMTS